jgi:N-carbamoylputrescine amidase
VVRSLFYPTAIGWHPEEKEQYENQMVLECYERTCSSKWGIVAAANRIGLEQYLPDTAGIEFWGLLHSWTTRQFWQAHTQRRDPAEVDLDLQENVRQNWPFFRDRRIDAF